MISMPLYYVYMLKCVNRTTKESTLYTGSTQDLVIRFGQHQRGKGAKYTRGKELELVYFETHLTRSEAMKREYEIKQLSSEKKWEMVENFQQRMKKEKNESNKELKNKQLDE